VDALRPFLATYGYPALFFTVLLENAGIPIPGETAVLIAGFLASETGGAHFSLAGVMLVTAIAAVIGDNIGFWLGYRYARPYLLAGRRFLFVTPRMLKVAEKYFERFGLWTIFFQRFITGIRVIGAIAAGTAGMPWPRFLLANASGALAWAVTMALLGYCFANSLHLLEKWIGRTGLILLGCAVLAIIITVFYRRWSRRESETGRAPAPASQAEPSTTQGSSDAPSVDRLPSHPRILTSESVAPNAGRGHMAEKVVIIGSGPAGWTAAIYAARANLQPLVFEGAVNGENQDKGTLPLGQLNLTTEVENFPTWPHVDSSVLAQFSESALPPERFANLEHLYRGKSALHGKRSATGPEQMEYVRQQAVNFGTRIVTEDILRVDFGRYPFVLFPSNTALESEGRRVEGAPVEAMTVIIATGARANYLGLPSEERFKNNGVSACAVCDGALPRFRNKPLVVIGGGDSAVEEATYLSKFGSLVYLVHRRRQLRASKIMQSRLYTNPKVVVLGDALLEDVLGNEQDGVTGVRLLGDVGVRNADGTFNDFRAWMKLHKTAELELKASGVFLAIGHTPNTAFLQGQIELNEAGYVRWTKPQRTYTSVEGVYAAGDVADDHYRQAVTAAGTGCMAALDAERWLAARGEL
jgi:thioredoxin reductase (NADPH)